MSDNRPREYAFFLAGGKMHEAADMVERIKVEREETFKKLERKYGSRGMFRAPMNDGKFVFAFDDGIPEGWKTTQERQPGQPDFAAPPLDSRDHMMIRAAYDMLEEYRSRDTLEKIFGWEDMPRKKIPAETEVSRQFIIEHSTHTGKKGRFHNDAVMCSWSNGAFETGDPVLARKLCDRWIIRVPCDGTGEPRITPPDSTALSFEDALKWDDAHFSGGKPPAVARRCRFSQKGPTP